MNTSPAPTTAERLARLTNGELAVKLSLTRAAFLHGITQYQRERAMREINDINAEYARRGEAVPA
jgi:hypothetical protein